MINYDTNAGILSIALKLKHTVMIDVFSGCDFWVFFIFHLIIFFSYRTGLLPKEETGAKADWSLDFNFVKVITAITTFFEVFYANQCYGKYGKMYDITKGMFLEASNFAHTIRVWLRAKAPNHVRLGVRYMSASMMLHFLHMKGKTAESDMSDLFTSGLLKSNEWKAIARHDSSQWSLIMLGWANEAALSGCKAADEKSAANGLTTALTKVYGNMQRVSDSLALPVPFQYYHLLSKMVACNVFLWAYSMGTTDSCFAPLVFVLCTGVFLGMMRLSSALADPFGTDDVDFPMDQWFLQNAELVFAVSEKAFLDGSITMDEMVEAEEHPPRLSPHFSLLGNHEVPAANKQGRGGASETIPLRNPYAEMRAMP